MNSKIDMRFFQKYPRKGDDVTMPGFAQGLRQMALALERMTVQDGYIDWEKKVPRLVFEGGGAGIAFSHPFKVSLVKNDSDDYQLIVSKGRLHFWNKDSWDIEPKEITLNDNWTVSESGGVYTAEYIGAQLKYENDTWEWFLAHGTENPQETGSTIPDSQTQRTWILAYMDTDGSIDQRINQDIYETMGG